MRQLDPGRNHPRNFAISWGPIRRDDDDAVGGADGFFNYLDSSLTDSTKHMRVSWVSLLRMTTPSTVYDGPPLRWEGNQGGIFSFFMKEGVPRASGGR